MNLTASGFLKNFAVPVEDLSNCDAASDHRHEFALGIGVAVDVPLRCLD
jgi:hypothetical protein